MRASIVRPAPAPEPCPTPWSDPVVRRVVSGEGELFELLIRRYNRRPAAGVLDRVWAFGGERCDRVVASVMRRLGLARASV